MSRYHCDVDQLGFFEAATIFHPLNTFGALILEIAKSALPLQILVPQHTWVDAQTAAWVAAPDALSRRIGPALQRDDDAKVGLVLDWLRTPSMVLVPFLQSSANHNPELKAFLARPADDLAGPGLQATTGHVAKALDALLSDSTYHTAMDFSGWSADLLLPVRGRPDIMNPIIDLLRAITNCKMPLEVYWLITAGSLAAIHKLDEDALAGCARRVVSGPQA